MPTRHTVRSGDCISSIAFENGFFPETIWTDPANADLKRQRRDPSVLKDGDVVVVMDKRIKEVSKPTEKRHRFRRRGVPEKLRLQLRRYGRSRANLPYVLDVEGSTTKGTTDQDGFLEAWIPPDAERALLILNGRKRINLHVGYLQPASEERGARERLANMGYLESVDADQEAYRQALESFQADHGLEVTGELSTETQEKLKEEHKS